MTGNIIPSTKNKFYNWWNQTYLKSAFHRKPHTQEMEKRAKIRAPSRTNELAGRKVLAIPNKNQLDNLYQEITAARSAHLASHKFRPPSSSSLPRDLNVDIWSGGLRPPKVRCQAHHVGGQWLLLRVWTEGQKHIIFYCLHTWQSLSESITSNNSLGT